MKDRTITERQKRWKDKNNMKRLQVWLSPDDLLQLDKLLLNEKHTSHAEAIRALLHDASEVWNQHYLDEANTIIKKNKDTSVAYCDDVAEKHNDLVGLYNSLLDEMTEMQEGAQLYRKRADEAEAELKKLRLSNEAVKAADLKTAQDEAAYWKAETEKLRTQLAGLTTETEAA